MASTRDLPPNPRNPRKITDKRLARLRRSLAEFGDLSGIVFNRQTGQLVAGHQRCAAWELAEPGAIEYDQRLDQPNDTGTVALGRIVVGGETFAYREVQWDSTREKAANLAANRAAGEWDVEALGSFVKDLDEAKFDLDLTMFDESEIDQMLGRDPKQSTDGEDAPVDTSGSTADQMPEPSDCVVHCGEVWALGRHRLMCGDALNDADVARLMGEHEPTVVLTEPPQHLTIASDDANADNSEVDYDPDHLMRQMPWSAEMVLWGADHYREKLPIGGSWCCWDKRLTDAMDQAAGDVFELAWWRTPRKREMARILWSGQHGLQGEDTRSIVHPDQKPVALIKWCFERLKGEVVADPFAGSGATLIACEQAQRTCLAMEIDPLYCQVIIDRWQELTGRSAHRLHSPADDV